VSIAVLAVYRSFVYVVYYYIDIAEAAIASDVRVHGHGRDSFGGGMTCEERLFLDLT
jgi:hypothetical protein